MTYIPLTGQDYDSWLLLESGAWLLDNLSNGKFQSVKLQRGDFELVVAWSGDILTDFINKINRIYDGYDLGTIAQGSPGISNWSSGVGTGNSATQGVVVNQPTYNGLNRNINFGSGRTLNFEGFGGGATFTGTVYITTSSGIYAYGVTVPSNISSFEWGRRESGLTVNAIVFVNGTLTSSELTSLNQWFSHRHSSGVVNYNSAGITSLLDRFRADLEVNLYGFITSIINVPDTTNVTNFQQAWRNCSSLTSFPLINTAAGTNFLQAWSDCGHLTSFPLINTAAGTNFQSAWLSCISLTESSFDNILISLAAGLSNNPGKTVDTTQTFLSVPTVPTNINRRGSDGLDWRDWETTVDTRFSGAVALKSRNETFGTGANQVTYNFSNGISGQQARLWMLARGTNFSVSAPNTPPSLPGGSRVYRSNSGVIGSDWTPVSGTSNQTLIGSPTPTTSTLHGLTNVLLGGGKGIQFGGLTTGNYTVYIGLARGYYKFTANNVGTTAMWGTELATGTGVLSIVLFFGTPTDAQNTVIINWINFYGSYNNLDTSDSYTGSGAKQTSFT